MISFRQYLTEARMAPLYHATSYDKFLSILLDGILPRTRHSPHKLGRHHTEPSTGDGIQGVSLTRSLPFAKAWGHVIFELDQQLLAQRYKIVPFQYFQSAQYPARYKESVGYNRYIKNEYEEFVITNKPIPMKYVKRLYFIKYMMSVGMLDRIQQIKNQQGLKFDIVYY